MNHEGGRYRVLLIAIGDNTEEKRESFCRNISEIYGISFELLGKIVDRCPTVLKKNLPLKKAEALAKTLESFGAAVSVEERRDSAAVDLEFQGGSTHQIALEASYLRRTESGACYVVGRARNISEASLNDTWVLIQLFDDLEGFLTFEEVPLPINPLPPREASPFKVIFEGELPIKRAAIAFKNSSGAPVSAIDRRDKKEWVEVKWETKEEEDDFPSSTLLSREDRETRPANTSEPSIKIPQTFDPQRPHLVTEELPRMTPMEEEKVPGDHIPLTDEEGLPERGYKPAGSFEPQLSLPMTEDIQKMIALEEEKIPENNLPFTDEQILLEKGAELSEKVEDLILSSEEDRTQGEKEGEGIVESEASSTLPPFVSKKEDTLNGAVDSLNLEPPPPRYENIFRENRYDLSLFEEATKLLEEISKGPAEGVKEEPSPFSWIDDFRNSVEVYYQEGHDIFSSWFQASQEEEKFANPLHSVLTILVHARFNQITQSEEALENTKKVFKLILQPNLLLEEIPLLEGTPFFSGENWRELFYRAIPKLQQVANNIIEKKKWNTYDLERSIQIIPHMSDRNSWMAIRWIHQLIPNVIEVDLSDTPVAIGENLYRVASRLGVVDPLFDFYDGKNSTGDLKIQDFAKAVYPRNPMKIEEPMAWAGMMKEERGGGYCLPTRPHCTGCPFETFCPRLHLDFDPSEKGMKRR